MNIRCEIQHPTTGIIINESVKDNLALSEILREAGLGDLSLYYPSGLGSSTFCQDPLILLYGDGATNPYVVEVIPGHRIPIKVDLKLHSRSSLDYGGNWISSPSHPGSDSVVFYVKTPTLNISELVTQKAVGLDCLFTGEDNGRHVDELMTFMPYGGKGFKIWFYRIASISYTRRLEDLLDLVRRWPSDQPMFLGRIASIIDNLKEELKELNTKETSKKVETDFDFGAAAAAADADVAAAADRGTAVASRAQADKDQDGVSWDDDKGDGGLDELTFGSFDFGTFKKENLTRLLAQLEEVIAKGTTGNIRQLCRDLEDRMESWEDKQRVKIWLEQLPEKVIRFLDQEVLRLELETEQYVNANSVAHTLFKQPLAKVKDSFVFFPIHLLFDQNGSATITNPSVSNRILIEHNGHSLALFSKTDLESEELVKREMAQVRSFIYGRPIQFRFIDTNQYHRQEPIGGNLHCLIKNLY